MGATATEMGKKSMIIMKVVTMKRMRMRMRNLLVELKWSRAEIRLSPSSLTNVVLLTNFCHQLPNTGCRPYSSD